MKKVIEKIRTYTDWNIDYDGEFISLENWSPAGENLIIEFNCNSKKDFIDEIKSTYENFDVEDHVRMWLNAKRGGTQGVPDVVTLVDDAREIEKMYKDLMELFI